MKILTDEELENVERRIGSHITHCCGKHGCKYGKDDCPVEQKEYAQKYACEYCVSSETLERKIQYLQEELEWNEQLKTLGIVVEDYDDVYFYGR